MAQYFVVPASNVRGDTLRLPDDVSFADASTVVIARGLSLARTLLQLSSLSDRYTQSIDAQGVVCAAMYSRSLA